MALPLRRRSQDEIDAGNAAKTTKEKEAIIRSGRPFLLRGVGGDSGNLWVAVAEDTEQS